MTAPIDCLLGVLELKLQKLVDEPVGAAQS